MYPTWAAAAVAMTFVWLGMVLAISFLEAPLKFRAPGVTIPLGLGIGRLVFRALNLVEAVLAAAIVVTVAVGDASTVVVAPAVATVVLLLAQLLVVRPRLNRRSDRILAGEDLPRSHEHFFYVGLESAKVAALIALGVGLLTIG
ncbi:hypothetical protein [Streptomyces sp. NPDC057616]|uniref:hypothetical protein n=1 Tax=Streptomyces sp. NPDC057616 TaxID=3346183 RepID=UPI0036A4AC5E